MKSSQFTRKIWLWLLNEGGMWTASEIARILEEETDDVFNALSGMERRNLIRKEKSAQSRRLAYGIDGTCLVPCGLAVAEVQVD